MVWDLAVVSVAYLHAVFSDYIPAQQRRRAERSRSHDARPSSGVVEYPRRRLPRRWVRRRRTRVPDQRLPESESDVLRCLF